MSEMSDSLFGTDGTELPEVLPDPAGRSAWQDTAELPPLELPPVPDASVLREAIAAVLSDNPDATSQPREEPPEATAPQAPSAAPQAGASPPGGAPAHSTDGPLLTAGSHPSARLLPRGIGGLRHRSPLAGASREPVPQVNFGRRTSRRGPVLPLGRRSNGGAGIALVLGVVITVVLLYYLIAGIVESFARLIPW